MRTLNQLEISRHTILLQMSLDVPMAEGTVTDDARLQASVPTIEYLISKECRVVITGHVGRPDGKADHALSTAPVAKRLSEILGREVTHIPHVAGERAKEALKEVPTPGVAMLENIRYDAREEQADETFAQELAMLADAFVNDDYPDAHRAYACNVLVPRIIPGAAGTSFAKEVDAVRIGVENPTHPVVLIVGGSKADKIGPINHLIGIADTIIVGGVLANTFLKASGADIKGSKYDERSLEIAGEFLRDAEEKFLLPVDVVASKTFADSAEHKEAPLKEIPEGWIIMDVGSQTLARYTEAIKGAKTVIWGGPIGVFEIPAFRRGTEEIAKAMASSEAFTLVAGGDSGAAVHQLGLTSKMSHVSIGGGATLKLIAGEELPAVEALK